MTDTRKIITVTQLNEYIKMMLDSSPTLANIYVKGEISNFTNHYKTGHLYFTVKDEGSVVRAIMFAGHASKLKFVPENGMKVIVHARVSSYVRDGQYQLYVDSMEPDGIGALYVAFEQLKKKLEAEGLFSEAKKKPLPKIPTRVGVVTSPTGAAVRDIINITGRRFPYAKVILYPALVQGEGAAKSVIDGIRTFNREKNVDVIIIGRGGGSIEDLWGFNDEALAREIFSSEIPIISAVGHETDFTISDFVADKRAPTPSAAAEIAVPDTEELVRKINNVTGRMELLLVNKIKVYREFLSGVSKKRVMTSPLNIIEDKRMAVVSLTQRLDSAGEIQFSKKKSEFAQLSAKLDMLNPLGVLLRGYAVADVEGKGVVNSVKNINKNDVLTVRLSDGSVKATVNEINEKRGSDNE